MPELILASTSRYRAELLARLHLPFRQAAPETDETAAPGEDAVALCQRLALAKAQAVSRRHPGAWCLGSDQAAARDGRLLGKPGDRARNHEQLAGLSGRRAVFATGLALVNSEVAQPLCALDLTEVQFRVLTAAEIDRYLDREPAADCAGGFKIEGLGISLFDQVLSRDPTGLIGLPLIATARLLRAAGYTLP